LANIVFEVDEQVVEGRYQTGTKNWRKAVIISSVLGDNDI